jgi:hypothetical protein
MGCSTPPKCLLIVAALSWAAWQLRRGRAVVLRISRRRTGRG